MASALDFRNLDEGIGRQGKRKRTVERLEEEMQASKRVPVAMEADDGEKAPPVSGGNTGSKVSGRKWRAAPEQRATAICRTPQLRTSWERKMAAKKEHKMFQARREELKEQIKANKQAKRLAAEASKKRKEENEAKSMVVQKISNPKTIKKMMANKKQRKLLKKAAVD